MATNQSIVEESTRINAKASDQENNKKTCRLLNIHLKKFFDDIYIPYDHFTSDRWKINKIIRNNEDSLFYNKTFLTSDIEENFHKVFNKYVHLIEGIMNPSNRLMVFLKKWTDMSGNKWKSIEINSYLKRLLTDHKYHKYQIISPQYVVIVYDDLCKQNRIDNDNINTDKVKFELEEHLNDIMAKVRTEKKQFIKKYNDILTSFVYKYHHNDLKQQNYVFQFIQNMLIIIFEFAHKLLDLNIYAIHTVISNIIGNYIPLNEINQYDPSENDGRKIIIV